MTQSSEPPARLRIRGARKSFGATKALDGVDLRVAPGEVHALIGENGAGKSTLMKVLGGALTADRGVIHVDGRAVSIDSPVESRRLGISVIQHSSSLYSRLLSDTTIARTSFSARVFSRPRKTFAAAVRLSQIAKS